MEKWHFVKKSSEPSRRKTHWDFVLEEMCWLAKDFFQVSTQTRFIALEGCHLVCNVGNRLPSS